MFLAANETGKFFIAKRVWADGEMTVSNKGTFERTEAYQFATEEEANTAAKTLFRKSAGLAVPAVPAVSAVSAEPKASEASVIPGFRPSRHQIEEASIHGDHELYT